MAKAQTQATETPVTQPVVAPKEAPKPGQLKELFGTYERANKAVEAASTAYDKAMADRSKVVEQFAAFGSAFTSPKGDRLTISARTNKETGAKSFYFKGPGKAEALKIE